MYPVSTSEVIILDRVKNNPASAARIERMLAAIDAEQITTVDDAGLAEIMEERGWRHLKRRTGQHRRTGAPALIFNAFQWLEQSQFDDLEKRYGALRGNFLLGKDPWTLRDHGMILRDQNCVCQSAYEIHCAHGCLHTCDYCFVPPYFNITLNLEELAKEVRRFGETIPHQKLYKFDNQTDTICLEPEYGASKIMVDTFAEWPGRYLLLYTKSDNVDHLLDMDHNGHTLVSWSLNCDTATESIEKGTPTLNARIGAMEKCQKAGYPVRARFSPMCPVKNWREEYDDLIERLLARVRPDVITLDVLGWMNPDEMIDALDVDLFDVEYADTLRQLTADGFKPVAKHLFPHRMRADILRFVIERINEHSSTQRVSICVETPEMWRELGTLMTDMNPGNYVCVCGPTSVPGNPLFSDAR
jgi:hypothetical protein